MKRPDLKLLLTGALCADPLPQSAIIGEVQKHRPFAAGDILHMLETMEKQGAVERVAMPGTRVVYWRRVAKPTGVAA